MTDASGADGDRQTDMGRIVSLSRDLFFGMRVRTIVGKLGYDLKLVKDESGVVDAVSEDDVSIVIIDFNQPVDWDELLPVLSGETPVLAFGSHTDVDGFRAAKAAGVTRVVSNGEFSRRLPELIEQYLRR
ncbi:MAG TPA: hypothetical protein VKZ61_04875 [Thermomicrobiales bacterium]|jgi:hypothetical protein|nr:hypothetical protein [Thermomicrobiales bacterium]